MPAIQAEPTVQNPLANVSSHFRLGTVISEQSLEEVVCGAHIALHKRTPCSIEILFCNSRTTEVDVDDLEIKKR